MNTALLVALIVLFLLCVAVPMAAKWRRRIERERRANAAAAEMAEQRMRNHELGVLRRRVQVLEQPRDYVYGDENFAYSSRDQNAPIVDMGVGCVQPVTVGPPLDAPPPIPLGCTIWDDPDFREAAAQIEAEARRLYEASVSTGGAANPFLFGFMRSSYASDALAKVAEMREPGGYEKFRRDHPPRITSVQYDGIPPPPVEGEEKP